MGDDNNWLYFMCSRIVTASCSFYGKEMSGSQHNWGFYEAVYSTRSTSLWDGMLSYGPAGSPGLYTFCGCPHMERVSNDQILYCLLIDGPRAKACGDRSYLIPSLTIFILTLWVGDNRVGDSPLSVCWWMASVWANPGLFFMHFHTVERGGGGACLTAWEWSILLERVNCK